MENQNYHLEFKQVYESVFCQKEGLLVGEEDGVETRSKKKCDKKKGHNSCIMDPAVNDREQLTNASQLTTTMHLGLDAISPEIRDLKAELIKDLTVLKERVSKDVKSVYAETRCVNLLNNRKLCKLG